MMQVEREEGEGEVGTDEVEGEVEGEVEVEVVPPASEERRRQVLALVARELHCAQLLTADTLAGPACALGHVLELWRGLAWLSRGELPSGPGESLADWLAPAELAQLPEAQHAGQHERLCTVLACVQSSASGLRELGASEVPELPSAAVLLADLRALAVVLRALEQREYPGRRRLRWLARGAAALLLGALVVGLAWRPWQTQDAGPWRAAYYPSKIFEGRPDLGRAADVAFDWGQTPPTESIPTDFYSARFDTCLVLNAEQEVAFMLVSDNGSRLLIDGELRVDNWARQRGRAVQGERVRLGAGVHHLRVEYFEDRGDALLHLTASFARDELPSPIPAARLRFPGMSFDAAQPCAEAP